VRLAYNFAIVLLGDRAFLDAIALALGSTGGAGARARDYVLELGPPSRPTSTRTSTTATPRSGVR
jgi:hypothetical protein